MDLLAQLTQLAPNLNQPELESTVCAEKDGMCFHPQFNSLVRLEVIAGAHIAYLVIIFGLRYLLKGCKPLNVKYPMMLYNVIQVVASTTMTIGLAPYLLNYVFNLNGKFNATIEFWVLFHYVTKFLDMFDSLFMVLRQKDDQLSFLHVYHHCTIGAIWGCLLHFGFGNGAAFFGAWINSLVHALMYFHYFWTSLGLRNPFKKYLTLFQMFQFSLCILQAVLVLVFDQQFTLEWAVLQLCYHMTLLYLFLKFYLKSNGKKLSLIHI
eukprot:TRINITY_DN20663_c0_g1_i7.p2 TRINITY_DN20663_c0_g1~~TRINITY_DN20663_c0_g1_i7.p2  ORF type:complete len:265 (-),score=108.87 TRINITY_DN20663_c0_g1_i7:140-934(-)